MANQPLTYKFTVSGKSYTFTVTTDYIAFNENGAMGYIRYPFSTFLDKEVSPVGRGRREVRPVRPGYVLSYPYQVAYLVTFTGTAGYFNWAGRHRQYIRPVSSQAKALATAVAIARELSRQGRLWTGLLVDHATGATYYVKGFNYWLRKSNGNAIPEVRLYLARFKVNGLRRRRRGTYDLIILYSSEPLTSKAKVTLKEVGQYIIRSFRPGKESEESDWEKEINAIKSWLERNTR